MNWKRHVHSSLITHSPLLYLYHTSSYMPPKWGNSLCRTLYIYVCVLYIFSWTMNETQPSSSRVKREISRDPEISKDLGGAQFERSSIFINVYDYSFVNYSLFCLITKLLINKWLYYFIILCLKLYLDISSVLESEKNCWYAKILIIL